MDGVVPVLAGENARGGAQIPAPGGWWPWDVAVSLAVPCFPELFPGVCIFAGCLIRAVPLTDQL